MTCYECAALRQRVEELEREAGNPDNWQAAALKWMDEAKAAEAKLAEETKAQDEQLVLLHMQIEQFFPTDAEAEVARLRGVHEQTCRDTSNEIERLRGLLEMAQAHVRNVLGDTANGWINLAARDEILRRIHQDEDALRGGGE